MLKKIQSKLWKDKKGFTLVELIVVIVIIAILAAALVVSLVGYINKANNSAAQQEASDVYTATQAVISEAPATYKSVAAATAAPDALKTAVEEYLGDSIKGSFTYGTSDKSTLTNFVYTADNGKVVTYNAAATGDKWTVS